MTELIAGIAVSVVVVFVSTTNQCMGVPLCPRVPHGRSYDLFGVKNSIFAYFMLNSFMSCHYSTLIISYLSTAFVIAAKYANCH